MSELFTLKAAVREDQGKGASRRLRRTNRIPGIVYGSKEAPEAIALEHNEVVHQLENEAFYTSIIELDFGDRKEQVVLRDLQRHPFKPAILHLDLQRISATEKLLMRIPLHFFGGEMAPGVKVSGGVISRLISEVEVRCLPKDLPDFIDVDLSHLELNHTLHLSDLVLPQGVELIDLVHGKDEAVVTVYVPKEVEENSAAEAAPTAADVAAAAAEENKGGDNA